MKTTSLSKTLVVFLLMTYLTPATAQRSYLQKAYAAVGASKSLSNLLNWREAEKQLILKSVHDLPTELKNALTKSADDISKQAWTQIRMSDYREFKENGNRVNYEHLNFARRGKLSILCVGELVENKGRFLPEIVDGLWLILEESTWVLPAHLYNTQPDGPDPSRPILDLFSAETGAHLAWIKLLLGDQLKNFSPVLMNRIDAELKTRIIEPYLATDNYWWMGLNTKRKQNNWNIWINSNILKVAALADDQEERRMATIEKVLRSADKFVDAYPEDGGCDEGPAYWSAAGGALGEFLSLFSRISSGWPEDKSNEAVHNIGKYIYKVHIADRRFVNFADAPAASIPDMARVFNFGELFDDKQLKEFAAYLRKISGSPIHFLNPSSINVFANAVRIQQVISSIEPKAPMPRQSWLANLQIVNLRKEAGSIKGLTFMAKGGNNDESHNHNDIGNFMLYMDGEPVLIDLGKGTYTKQTFSSKRYDLWYVQSGWHNCPAINGVDQKAGAAFKASAVHYKPGSDKDVFSMDLAGAYPAEAAVKQWKREFIYQRNIGQLELNESYLLDKYISPSKLSFVACKQPVKEKEGRIMLSSFSGKPAVRMEYNPAELEVKIEEQIVDDGSLSHAWGKSVYRVILVSKHKALNGGHTLRFSSL